MEVKSREEQLVELKNELNKVKRQIAKYEINGEEKELSDTDKLLHLSYMDKEKVLKEEMKALEGSL